MSHAADTGIEAVDSDLNNDPAPVAPAKARVRARRVSAPAAAAEVDTDAAEDPVTAFLASTDRFINRETSWLEFNRRVLEEAENPGHPLMERLRFLAISGSNLDEFYMVRVAGLRGLIREGSGSRMSMDGLTPQAELDAVAERARELLAAQARIWNDLHEEMRAAGMALLAERELTKGDKTWLRGYFRANIFPVLTPRAVDPAHPFPFIDNLGFAVVAAVQIEDRRMRVLLPIPNTLARFIALPERRATKGGWRRRHVAVETVIGMFLDEIYPAAKVRSVGAFRIIRDSDIDIEEEAEDLVAFFEDALKKRRRGDLVRLKFDARTPEGLRRFVSNGLRATPADIAVVDGPLGLKDFMQLIPSDEPDWVFEPFHARAPERLQDSDGDIFAAIRSKDVLVHHPYETFDTVVRFLSQAAADDNVIAIKQTLYRTSTRSPIVRALCEAAEDGKNVTAVVELKARFDEEKNLRFARDLEAAGVQVVYGFVKFKTHAKLSVVVRKEPDGLRTYTHVGTGNYHPDTARIYTDVSVFTADPAVAHDAGLVFNYVTGYARPSAYNAFAVSPHGLKSTIIDLLNDEIRNAKAGKPSGVWMKMNALVHPEIIDALYAASQAGVPIELIVRGICCLKPGVPGVSETIQVKSIIGRYLEHSRIYCFAAGHAMPSRKNKVFISSADLMPRNLDRRVEVMAPVTNATAHAQVLDQIMVANINDEQQSWYLKPDGEYRRFDAGHLADPFSCHEYFMTRPSLSGRGAVDVDDLPPTFDHVGPRWP